MERQEEYPEKDRCIDSAEHCWHVQPDGYTSQPRRVHKQRESEFEWEVVEPFVPVCHVRRVSLCLLVDLPRLYFPLSSPSRLRGVIRGKRQTASYLMRASLSGRDFFFTATTPWKSFLTFRKLNTYTGLGGVGSIVSFTLAYSSTKKKKKKKKCKTPFRQTR